MKKNKALWHVYLYGRMSFEGTLGHVIAEDDNFDWIKKTSYTACDILKTVPLDGSIDLLLE